MNEFNITLTIGQWIALLGVVIGVGGIPAWLTIILNFFKEHANRKLQDTRHFHDLIAQLTIEQWKYRNQMLDHEAESMNYDKPRRVSTIELQNMAEDIRTIVQGAIRGENVERLKAEGK